LTSYTWPTDAIPVARLAVQLDDLAVRLGTPVQKWVVDGLGPARGFTGRLPSGRVIGLADLEVATRLWAVGPMVLVDATDLAAAGAEAIADEVVAGLGLSREHLAQVSGADVRQEAEELIARMASTGRTPRPPHGLVGTVGSD
jgi:hypothetical protein